MKMKPVEKLEKGKTYFLYTGNVEMDDAIFYVDYIESIFNGEDFVLKTYPKVTLKEWFRPENLTDVFENC